MSHCSIEISSNRCRLLFALRQSRPVVAASTPYDPLFTGALLDEPLEQNQGRGSTGGGQPFRRFQNRSRRQGAGETHGTSTELSWARLDRLTPMEARHDMTREARRRAGTERWAFMAERREARTGRASRTHPTGLQTGES